MLLKTNRRKARPDTSCLDLTKVSRVFPVRLPVRQGRRIPVLVESLKVQTCRFLGHPSFQDLPELGSLYLDLPTVLDVSLFIQKTSQRADFLHSWKIYRYII